MTRRPLKNRGDTIVEVLIVVLVLGLIISVAYAVASRSQRYNRQVEERTQALKVAEGQFETLRTHASAIPDNSKFCFDTAGQLVALPNGVQTADAAAEPFQSYPDGCKYVPDGGNCTSYCYYVSITKTSNDNYSVMIRWDGVTGRRDQLVQYYRIGAPS